jgi:hypothetical protein
MAVPVRAPAPWHIRPISNTASGAVRPTYAQQAQPTATPNVNVQVTKTATSFIQPARPVPVDSFTKQSPATGNVVAPKEEWSAAMKTYVERCFSRCKTPAQRDKMEEILRVRIKTAIADGSVSRINWHAEPMPLLGSSQPQLQPQLQLQPRLQSQPQTQTQTQTQTQPVPLTNRSSEAAKLADRAKRFEADARAFQHQQHLNRLALQNVSIAENQSHVMDWDEYTIVGTCQKLEKPYLRLTSAPDPATVRPLPVLRKALAMLKDRWKQGAVEYAWICDQFKSLRQDITVQRIKSDFTVQVYEIHARIAVEQGDLGEYNQCQTQLKQLYILGLKGCEAEFLAYRLLYLLHCQNAQDVNMFVAELDENAAQDPAVKHALQVREALLLGNYARLFRLYGAAPNMGGYLMDWFMGRERLAALGTVLRAYRPSIKVSWLAATLAFPGEAECRAWLSKDCSLVCPETSATLDCKAQLALFRPAQPS